MSNTHPVVAMLALGVLFATPALADHFATPFESEGDFSSIYLDRHEPKCSKTSAMSGFKLVRERVADAPTGRMRYEYTCVETEITKFGFRATAWNDEGNGNSVFLDRHAVACDRNQALMGFMLSRQLDAHNNTTGKFRYTYACGNVQSSDVKYYATPFNDDGGGANIFLDRHSLQCPSGSALNSFRLERNAGGTEYRFVYGCIALKLSSSLQELVAEMNDIIDAVSTPLAKAELNESFYSSGGLFSQAKYVLFGESHDDYDSLLLQARAIETFVKPTDLILAEGGKSGEKHDCLDRIFKLYALKKWKVLKRKYEPVASLSFRISLEPLFKAARPHLNLDKLKIGSAKCMYWDDPESIDLNVSRQSLISRNESMVGTMKTLSPSYDRVFVTAGLLHLPRGEMACFHNVCSKNALRGPNFDDKPSEYYLFTSFIGGCSPDKRFAFGSTETIHEYLGKRDYIEIFPKSLLSDGGVVSKSLFDI